MHSDSSHFHAPGTAGRDVRVGTHSALVQSCGLGISAPAANGAQRD